MRAVPVVRRYGSYREPNRTELRTLRNEPVPNPNRTYELWEQHVNEQVKKRAATLWKPGESGNPAGRPLGSRNKLSESVIQDIAADWAIGGPETIARVRMTDPATYFRVVASILPKDVLVNVQQQTPGGLDPEAWATLRSLLDVIQRVGIEGEPQQVFEMIETDLRARLASDVSRPVSIEHSAIDKADSDQ
jgi:Family of unknown function (DUF5681)